MKNLRFICIGLLLVFLIAGCRNEKNSITENETTHATIDVYSQTNEKTGEQIETTVDHDPNAEAYIETETIPDENTIELESNEETVNTEATEKPDEVLYEEEIIEIYEDEYFEEEVNQNIVNRDENESELDIGG